MPPPSKGQIEVATDSLRSEAGIWDEQSDQLGKIVVRANGLRLDRLEAGIFQLVVAAYSQVVDQVSGRSREGQQRMTEVGSALTKAAITYEQEEQENLHRLKNLY